MGYLIREMREKRGLTQNQLAEKSGVCRTTISALESGRDCVTTTKTPTKIANAMGVTIDEIFKQHVV